MYRSDGDNSRSQIVARRWPPTPASPLPQSEAYPTQDAVPQPQSVDSSAALAEMLKEFMRFSQAQSCPAKPPDKFLETHKSNISTWLDSLESYLKSRGVPQTEWARTLETFLAESALAKARRARLLESTSNYDDYKQSLIPILGKPEERELLMTQLDGAKQHPSESIADYGARILELVSKAWGTQTPPPR